MRERIGWSNNPNEREDRTPEATGEANVRARAMGHARTVDSRGARASAAPARDRS